MVYKPYLFGRVIVVDTETTGLSTYHGARAFGYAFANTDGETVFVLDDGPKGAARERVRKWMADTAVVKVCHNLKFDLKMCRANGIELRGRLHDTMVIAHLLYMQGHAGPKYRENCLKRLALDVLAHKYLQSEKLDAPKVWLASHRAEFTREHNRAPNFSDVPLAIMDEYARRDAWLTMQLFYLSYPALKKYGLMELYKNEIELLTYIIEMEDRGCLVDLDWIEHRIRQLNHDIAESKRKLLSWMTGPIRKVKMVTRSRNGIKEKHKRLVVIPPEEVNLGSDDQVRKIVYGQLGMPVEHWTGSQDPKPKVDERTLVRMTHPFCKELIALNQNMHQLNAFFLGYRDRQIGGVLHPNYIQMGTNTGRFSSNDPNLQNLPTEEVTASRGGVDVVYRGAKEMFIPRPDYTNYHFDYKQIELVMFAHWAKDDRVTAIIKSGRDVHSEVCLAMYGEVTEKKRVEAKRVNFGILYGMGKETFAWRLKVTEETVLRILELYYKTFPGVRAFQNRVMGAVRRNAMLHNLFGRRYLIEPKYAYKGVNYLCQGNAADLMKHAMVRVGRLLRGFKSHMLMTIHDELVVEIHKSEESWLPKAIVEAMSYCPQIDLPVRVEVERAVPNWGNLIKVELAA